MIRCNPQFYRVTKNKKKTLRLVVAKNFFYYAFWVQVSVCTPVTLAVPYMFVEFAECSVNHGINRGTQKLVRIPI